jgi:hypothetical protein
VREEPTGFFLLSRIKAVSVTHRCESLSPKILILDSQREGLEEHENEVWEPCDVSKGLLHQTECAAKTFRGSRKRIAAREKQRVLKRKKIDAQKEAQAKEKAKNGSCKEVFFFYRLF